MRVDVFAFDTLWAVAMQLGSHDQTNLRHIEKCLRGVGETPDLIPLLPRWKVESSGRPSGRAQYVDALGGVDRLKSCNGHIRAALFGSLYDEFDLQRLTLPPHPRHWLLEVGKPKFSPP